MIVGVAGLQNSGKTTLIERLVPRITAGGFRVATVKHIAHDDLRVDPAGTDTRRHRNAGAALAVAASPTETVYFHEGGIDVADLGGRLAALGDFDLILVEGFKRSEMPKIVIGRVEHGGEARWRWDGTLDGAEALAEALMEEIRAERARAHAGGAARSPSPARHSAGARSRLRGRRPVGGRRP